MDNSAVYSLVHFPGDVNEIKHMRPQKTHKQYYIILTGR